VKKRIKRLIDSDLNRAKPGCDMSEKKELTSGFGSFISFAAFAFHDCLYPESTLISSLNP